MRWSLFLCFFVCVVAQGQMKDYTIGVRGDTLNGVDKAGKKQGKWVVRHDEVRGEPGFEEEGVFKDDRKEGIWKKFTLMGDKFADENYRWGYKDGVSKYYNISGDLLKEESWRAFNPDQAYDTVQVEDLFKPDTYTTVIVKNEGASIKNGTWKYYDVDAGFIKKTEIWVLGKLQNADNGAATKKANADSSAAVKVKPKEVMDFEKKNSGKKKVRVRDGSTF